jgi:hypothetical protein
VSALLARLRDHFLDPSVVAATAPTVQVAERAAPTALGVLCAPGVAAVAGTALGLAAAGRAGAACAVVCRWTGEDAAGPVAAFAGGGIALPAARRLAARLRGRGLAAVARGRVVSVALEGAAVTARAAAERAAAAAGDAPVVVVLAGPRPPVLDALLAAQDRLIVVPAPDAPAGLETLAVAEAARLGRGTGVLRLPVGTGGRAVVACGLLLGPALRAAADAALDGRG